MNADHINEHYYGDLAKPTTERTRQRIHWICSQAVGEDVLDIGCSQGIVSLILGREGFRCVGIDIEAGSLEVARQALAKEDDIVQQRVMFKLADCTQLPFEDASFDTVILGEVLEHFTQPAKVLSEAKRVLRDGGRLIVTVPFGLNAFHDHKCTYYPISLLTLLQPLFRTRTIETLNNYIAYTGIRDAEYDPAALSKEALFDVYLHLETALEKRCLEKERELLEQGTTLQERIRTVSAETAAQASKIRELEASLFAKEDGGRDLQLASERARESAALELESKRHAEAGTDRLRAQPAKSVAALAAERERIETLETEIASLRQELIAKDAGWQERLAQSESLHAARLRAREKYFQEMLAKRDAEANRKAVNQRIRDLVRTALPADAQVLIISKGDDDLLRLDGRHGTHFPQAPSGVYAGYHPASSADAIAHLQALKARGAQYLLIPAASIWWLDHYAEFREYLETSCCLLLYQEQTCILYALRAPSADWPYLCGISARNGDVTAPKRRTQLQSLSEETPKPIPPSLRREAPKSMSNGAERISLGVILDEFTMGCLEPECRLITFRPDNWRSVLERDLPDALFVESAWRGNEGSWLYRVANYQRNMGSELADLLHWAEQQGLPTIFWNKEDPVHFDRFIEHARLFSHVFTTDANCIPQYREQLGHDRIFPLPFAAQPAIHNPIQTEPRAGAVCFAGTYYGSRHQERQVDMEYLLRPAIPFGLEIYDRQQGVNGTGADTFRFPDIYQPHIKGRLDYDEMVKAYKRYRVFLNVNSVKQSSTMFSRRVFELLACGTPVISTYSQGIVELLGEDLVFFTESEADTHRHLERLLENEEEWARASVRGMRKVMNEHTYGHRLREAFERIGITAPKPREPRFSVVVRVSGEEELTALASLLGAQSYRRFDVVPVSETPISAQSLNALLNALPDVSVRCAVGPAAGVFKQCTEAAAEYLAFLDLRDSYGHDYLLDSALALRYSGADFIGKHTFYQADAAGERQLKQAGYEFKYVNSVQSASLVAKRAALSKDLFAQALNGRVFQLSDRHVLSIDRFNYLQNAFVGRTLEQARTRSSVQKLEVHA